MKGPGNPFETENKNNGFNPFEDGAETVSGNPFDDDESDEDIMIPSLDNDLG